MSLRILAVLCLLLVPAISTSESEFELQHLEEVLHKFQPDALEVLEVLKKEEIPPQISRACGLTILQKIVSTCGDNCDCKSSLLPALACQFKLNEKVFIELCCPTKL
ncbi:unnamed protein product [Caenorhabditis nigoni]